MDTIEGDKFVVDCARFIRYNEAKLGDVSAPNGPSSAAALYSSLTWINPASWIMAGGVPSPTPPSAAARTRTLSTPRPPAIQHRPMPFRITNHHLYYLLIRCEALGLPVGLLDVKVPKRARPSSYFAFISNHAAGATMRKRDREETMSISSLQTTMSVFGIGSGPGKSSGGGSYWWSSERRDVVGDLKYIYSAMTKLPALRIGPPPLKLIRDFEDCPGESSVPLDAFKNVQIIEFEDNDPRTYIGWDRLAVQLRSLSIKRSGVEDIQDIIIDAVVADANRRSGQVGKKAGKQRSQHSSAETETNGTGTVANNDAQGEEQDDVLAHQLPPFSWHFLRHLSLADNSLTFVHAAPMSCIANLTSLDLSSNLLNAVPPSLSSLKNLRSLNLSNNLIDSVLGIPLSIPNIQALNLSHNRLESLCGLERLTSLARVDLRHNEVFEAGEVGRLATLEHVTDVFIAENPLWEEEENPRVLIFVEFAKEGRDVDKLTLDGEKIGYFERQRVREAVPNLDRLVKTRSSATRNHTPFANELGRSDSVGASVSQDRPPNASGRHEGRGTSTSASTKAEEDEAQTANVSVIKSVRHRGQAHAVNGGRTTSSKAKEGHTTASGAPRQSTDEASAQPSQGSNIAAGNSRLGAASQQRRNRRVVDLADSYHDETQLSAPATDFAARVREESDSDLIKKAALSGDVDFAIGGSTAKSRSTDSSDNAGTTQDRLNRTRSKKGLDKFDTTIRGGNDDNIGKHAEDGAAVEGKKVMDAGRAEVRDGEATKRKVSAGKDVVTESEPLDSSARKVSTSDRGDADDLKSRQGQDLRRKIEALKGEVGDDWMRLLARGESA